MSDWFHLRPGETEQARRERIVAVASDVLAGQLPLIEGSVELWTLRPEPPEGEWADKDFHVFGVIDSDTDHLPIGRERANWSDEALRRKDIEIAEVEASYFDEVFATCERLIRRYGGDRLTGEP